MNHTRIIRKLKRYALTIDYSLQQRNDLMEIYNMEAPGSMDKAEIGRIINDVCKTIREAAQIIEKLGYDVDDVLGYRLGGDKCRGVIV